MLPLAGGNGLFYSQVMCSVCFNFAKLNIKILRSSNERNSAELVYMNCMLAVGAAACSDSTPRGRCLFVSGIVLKHRLISASLVLCVDIANQSAFHRLSMLHGVCCSHHTPRRRLAASCGHSSSIIQHSYARPCMTPLVSSAAVTALRHRVTSHSSRLHCLDDFFK